MKKTLYAYPFCYSESLRNIEKRLIENGEYFEVIRVKHDRTDYIITDIELSFIESNHSQSKIVKLLTL